tara:strand:- start:104 stop:622 length:519 start_codon:yes stop_codon:yes gene_type:complete
MKQQQKLILFVIVCCVLILGGGGVYWFFIRDDNSENNGNESSPSSIDSSPDIIESIPNSIDSSPNSIDSSPSSIESNSAEPLSDSIQLRVRMINTNIKRIFILISEFENDNYDDLVNYTFEDGSGNIQQVGWIVAGSGANGMHSISGSAAVAYDVSGVSGLIQGNTYTFTRS